MDQGSKGVEADIPMDKGGCDIMRIFVKLMRERCYCKEVMKKGLNSCLVSFFPRRPKPRRNGGVVDVNGILSN